MSVDNRTDINDCETEATNFSTTGANPALAEITDVGAFYEGSTAMEAQHSDNFDVSYTDEDSTGTAFSSSLDLSDTTVYVLLKDGGLDTYANGGIMISISDGTDRIGYFTGGNDAVGMPLEPFFNAYKHDISVPVATPPSASFIWEQSGTEANLDQAGIDDVGIATLHLAPAKGSLANLQMDAFCYMANGSYALTINGGTVGTPETMADVQADDIGGLLTGLGYGGMVSNPLGSQYLFFAPTEFGNVGSLADSYFTATGEQWFWVGDNAGGHAVGDTHFPFRVIGHADDTNSFVLNNVVIVNTGTAADFDCSSEDVDILEIDGCSLSGLASFPAPSSGGTSRFCTNTIFTSCGIVTHNGADMSGGSVLTSTVAADVGALLYNETSDPDTVMDGMTFSKGTNAHHAIDFGTNVDAEINLRNIEFTDFGTSEDGNDAALRFLDTVGGFNVNIIGCTVGGAAATASNLFKDDAAAASAITLVFDPVETLINIKDNEGNNEENVNVHLEASDGAGDMPFNQSIATITRITTEATVTFDAAHGLVTDEYINLDGITDKTEDNGGAQKVTVVNSTVLTYVTDNSGSTSYTGTITATGSPLHGLTDVNGDISTSRTYSGNQNLKGSARKSSATPRFKNINLAGTVVNSSIGVTVNRRLVLDE